MLLEKFKEQEYSKIFIMFNKNKVFGPMLIRTTKSLVKVVKNALSRSFDSLVFPHRINKEEALKILNLEQNFTPQELDKRYREFYSSNCPKNGGSLYIREKLNNAYGYLKSCKRGEGDNK